MSSLLSLGARAATMVVAFVCGVLTGRLITGEAGVEYYALWGALTALPSLLSFTDLGAGAVIVNTAATSADVRTDRKLLDQVTSVERILVCSAGVGLLLDAVLFLTGAWPMLLGAVADLPGLNAAAFVCFAMFCLQIPLGIWVRLQLGMHRNHIVILLQGLVSPLTLLGVWLMLQLPDPRPHTFLAVTSFGSGLLVAIGGFLLTARMTRPLLGTALRRVPRRRAHPGVRVMDVGWPMLAQLVSSPIAIASQRYVLLIAGTKLMVAEYNAAAQVFLALGGLVSAAGVALWPQFARRRAQGTLTSGPWALSGIFAAGVALATGCVLLVGPWLFGFISHGTFEVHTDTILLFGAMILCQAVLYPLGMFLMDRESIRFQVVPTLLMAALSLGLSIVLAPSLGVTGPIIAYIVAVTLCQIVPFALYIRANRDRLLSAPADPGPDAGVGEVGP